MELDWYCTGAVGMKQQSCWGALWFFKRPQVSPMEKQRNWQHVIWCLITNTWANRVAIVNSVITRYLTLANFGRSQFNLWIVHVQWISYSYLFASFSCHCSSVVRFSFIRFCSILFDYSVSVICLLSVFSVLRLELYSKYFYPQINNHPASQ